MKHHLLSAVLREQGVPLGDETCQRLELFLSELLRWNRKINLTSITEVHAAQEKHLVDSLLLLPWLGQHHSLLDLGSGAGLPGIPLQVARPDLHVTSIDSIGKKIRFQRHIKRLLELKNFTPCCVRVESLDEEFEEETRFELITARAFAPLKTIIELAEPWLAADGRLLMMKGPEGKAELEAAADSIRLLRLKVQTLYSYQLPLSAAERQLIVLKRV